MVKAMHKAVQSMAIQAPVAEEEYMKHMLNPLLLFLQASSHAIFLHTGTLCSIVVRILTFRLLRNCIWCAKRTPLPEVSSFSSLFAEPHLYTSIGMVSGYDFITALLLSLPIHTRSTIPLSCPYTTLSSTPIHLPPPN